VNHIDVIIQMSIARAARAVNPDSRATRELGRTASESGNHFTLNAQPKTDHFSGVKREA
jgi:hypothetical protein